MSRPVERELVRSFLCGIKDSIWLHDDDLAQQLIKKRLPRKVFKRKWGKGYVIDYWFFKDKTVKEQFIRDDIHNKLKEGIHDHLAMGQILGFPPKSVQIFNNETYTHSDKIGVSYCGMYFMSYKQSIVDDMQWLFQNKKPPLNKNFKIELSSYEHSKVLIYETDRITDINDILNDITDFLNYKAVS